MRRLTRWLVVGSLSACGARTELRVDEPDASVAADAAMTVDAPRLVDAQPAVDTAPPIPPCTWTATAPLAITLGDRDRSPHAVRVLDDRLWVGFQSSNPDPPGNQGRFVRVTDALGQPVAAAVEVLPSPGDFTSYGSLSLWTDPVTREHAAMSWTEGIGCIATGLDDAARPTGARVRLGAVNCASVVRAGRLWTYLTYGSSQLFTRFHVADAAGTEIAALALAPDGPTLTAVTRAALDDGTFLFAWAARGTNQVVLQRHALQGAALGAPNSYPIVRAGASVSALRVVPDEESILLAWVEVTTGDVVVMRADRNGTLSGAPVTVGRVEVVMGRPVELGLAVTSGVPAVAWSSTGGGGAGALRVLALDPRTLRASATVDVATARFPHNVFLRGTSQGLVAVFGAITTQGLTQVWTVPVRCLVPR